MCERDRGWGRHWPHLLEVGRQLPAPMPGRCGWHGQPSLAAEPGVCEQGCRRWAWLQGLPRTGSRAEPRAQPRARSAGQRRAAPPHTRTEAVRALEGWHGSRSWAKLQARGGENHYAIAFWGNWLYFIFSPAVWAQSGIKLWDCCFHRIAFSFSSRCLSPFKCRYSSKYT